MKVVANWKESLAFDVVSDNGHQIRVDTTIENGSLNSGMSPKKLILAGLCGCSGMDVVDILIKMLNNFDKRNLGYLNLNESSFSRLRHKHLEEIKKIL